jgi:hypothetical protein
MIHLQGIGYVQAKPAQDFRIGDYTVFNYGNAHKVVEKYQVSPQFIELVLESGHIRKAKKTTLLGWSSSLEDWMIPGTTRRD